MSDDNVEFDESTSPFIWRSPLGNINVPVLRALRLYMLSSYVIPSSSISGLELRKSSSSDDIDQESVVLQSCPTCVFECYSRYSWNSYCLPYSVLVGSVDTPWRKFGYPIVLLCMISARICVTCNVFNTLFVVWLQSRVDRLHKRHPIFLLQRRSPLLFAHVLQIVIGLLRFSIICFIMRSYSLSQM